SNRPRMSGGARIWSRPFAVVRTTGIVRETKKMVTAVKTKVRVKEKRTSQAPLQTTFAASMLPVRRARWASGVRTSAPTSAPAPADREEARDDREERDAVNPKGGRDAEVADSPAGEGRPDHPAHLEDRRVKDDGLADPRHACDVPDERLGRRKVEGTHDAEQG